MSAHPWTAGPWFVSGARQKVNGHPSHHVLAEVDEVSIASVWYADDTDALHCETFANARLIAAAPDLVEAVKRAIQFIENGLETRHVRMPDFVADPAHDTLPILRAALAKARGQ